MTAGMRALTKADGFPDLPVLRVCLITSPRNRTEMVQALESFLGSQNAGVDGRQRPGANAAAPAATRSIEARPAKA